MKALMDDVRFEEGGAVVRMRTGTGRRVYPSVGANGTPRSRVGRVDTADSTRGIRHARIC